MEGIFVELAKEWELDFRHARSLRKERLQRLLDSLNNDFINEGIELNPQLQGEIHSLIWGLFDGAIMLYSLGMNGPAIIELQGILEGFCISDIPSHLSRDDGKSKGIVKQLIERKSLVELANILNELGIWNRDDIKFTKDLNRIRNGIAHRNPKPFIVSSILDIESAMDNVDVIAYIIKSIHLIHKLSKSNDNQFQPTS